MIESHNSLQKQDAFYHFVNFIMQRCTQDKGFAALVKRADNPNTEYYSWEILAPFIDLTRRDKRIPYAYIAAALADGKITQNGHEGIGRLLALCYEQNGEQTHKQNSAKLKLRRLLACQSGVEACTVLRGLFSLIRANGLAERLDYAALLRELIYFNDDVKAKWASEFYRNEVDNE